MRIDILTLFPEMFPVFLNTSILKRAVERALVTVNIHNIRDYAHDKHHTVDDYPYGGGAGMVLKPGPIFEAVAAINPDIRQKIGRNDGRSQVVPIILLSPQGRLFSQQIAQELAGHEHLIFIFNISLINNILLQIKFIS